MGLEAAIPGHASEKDWARRLQSWLGRRGFSFEAEGEATRIRLENGVYVEVSEASGGDGFEVVVTVPLPVTAEEASMAESVREGLGIALSLGVRLRYELDDSMPDYPLLRVIAPYRDPYKLVDKLIEVLEPLSPAGRSD